MKMMMMNLFVFSMLEVCLCTKKQKDSGSSVKLILTVRRG